MGLQVWIDGEWVDVADSTSTEFDVDVFVRPAVLTGESRRVAVNRPSPMRRWLRRARHAWTVGLDGPLLRRVVTRVCYTFGWLRSPSDMGY